MAAAAMAEARAPEGRHKPARKSRKGQHAHDRG
jgi:hypothetical protein